MNYVKTNFFLINIYAPNSVQDRLLFYSNLLEIMKKYNVKDSIVMGGDFNTPLNRIDKIGVSDISYEVIDKIEKICDDFDLIDVWKFLHHDEIKFTWRRTKLLSQSRIDYYLISDKLLDNVKNCKIDFGFQSDHSMISLDLNTVMSKRGPGFWKFNAKLIEDLDYINGLKHKISKWNVKYDFNDRRFKWEYFKYKIKKYTIKISKNRAKRNKEKIKQLEAEVTQLESNLAVNDIKLFNEKKSELNNLIYEKTQGIIMRSKVKWVEEGESGTKYFFNLEKRNAVKKTITKLNIDGQSISDPKQILEEEYKFYSNLYAKNNQYNIEQENNAAQKFLSVVGPKLTDEQKCLCEGQITYDECVKVVKSLKNNKSPGNDGLTGEFYKIF